MANPNPNPATRFGADGVTNPGRGRQKAARDRFSTAFLEDLADDYALYGKAVIETVRTLDPATMLRVYSTLLPKQLEIDDSTPESKLTDAELEQLYQMMLAQKAEGKG
jgi:hypothetical protein